MLFIVELHRVYIITVPYDTAMEAGMDKRTQKTKTCILQALIKLLESKELDDITITELSEAAGINRKTFYAHYGSIYDVVEESGNEVAESLILLCREMSNDYSILNPDILFGCLNLLSRGDPEQFGAIFSNSRNNVIIHRFTDILSRHIKKALETSNSLANINPMLIPYIAAFISGGLINTYTEWGKNYPETKLDEVTQLTSTLIISGLQSQLNHGFSDGSH